MRRWALMVSWSRRISRETMRKPIGTVAQDMAGFADEVPGLAVAELMDDEVAAAADQFALDPLQPHVAHQAAGCASAAAPS
ncbi:hypothetical protein ABFY67_00900, partial [Pseudomonas aeruginosa]